ncbi:hypothetical protein K2Z84_08670, partial [Candidatus Binatia bacterium]|nr:hypothetical protein [Candidatus Binatia bacterium]
GAAAASARLRIRHLLLAGGQTLRLTGTVTVPGTPAVDPAANGLRVQVRNAAGTSLLDVTLPKGADWTYAPATTAWTFARPGGFAGVTRAVVTALAGSPNTYRVKVLAGPLALPVSKATLPLSATVVLDVPHANGGQCGDVRFPGPAPAPTCRIRHAGSRLICGG